jgi:ADP-ribose pyrophosphatase
VAGFRIVGSNRVAEAGFLAVDEVIVEADDDERFSRMVVRHPGAVVVVPVVDDDHAILLRQFRAATGGDLLEVPAGKRDVDGEPPEDTARRELAEEIRLRPRRLVKLAEFWNSPGFCDEYTHLYAAFDLEDTDEGEAATHEEAAMTIEHVAFADVDALIARRELVDAKSIIGLLLTRSLLAGEYQGIPG